MPAERAQERHISSETVRTAQTVCESLKMVLIVVLKRAHQRRGAQSGVAQNPHG
jgi:hypothetical protein